MFLTSFCFAFLTFPWLACTPLVNTISMGDSSTTIAPLSFALQTIPLLTFTNTSMLLSGENNLNSLASELIVTKVSSTTLKVKLRIVSIVLSLLWLIQLKN